MFDVVFLVGIEQVSVGSLVSAQVGLGLWKLWVSGQVEIVENGFDCFLKVLVPI